MKKKLLIGMTTLTLLTGCSNPLSVKTYPSIDLPYEIVNEEVAEIKEQGLTEYIDYQELKKVTVRELTSEENEKFLDKLQLNTLNDLNKEYSAIEFYFGDMTKISCNKKSFYQFDKNKSCFVYDDEIIERNIYQYEFVQGKSQSLDRTKKNGITGEDEQVGYGFKSYDFKIIILLKKELIKPGLQLKTSINDEIVYIDIK